MPQSYDGARFGRQVDEAASGAGNSLRIGARQRPGKAAQTGPLPPCMLPIRHRRSLQWCVSQFGFKKAALRYAPAFCQKAALATSPQHCSEPALPLSALSTLRDLEV